MILSTVDNLLHVGVSQAPITPPIGFTISGPEFPDRPARSIDDDLAVRCVVLKSYGETAAIVSLDAYGIADWLKGLIAQAITESTGIPRRNIIVLTTGNGTSPPLWRNKVDLPHQYRNYAAYLPDIVAGTALDAATSLEPAAVGTVTAALPNLSCFAASPDDEALETEREMLQLTAIQTAEGRTACLLYNFACPATIVGNTTAWTADFPGIASSALEEAGADAAIFIQGAAYDIRPFDWSDGNTDIIPRRPPMVGRPSLRHLASHANHPSSPQHHHPPKRTGENRVIQQRRRDIRQNRRHNPRLNQPQPTRQIRRRPANRTPEHEAPDQHQPCWRPTSFNLRRIRADSRHYRGTGEQDR